MTKKTIAQQSIADFVNHEKSRIDESLTDDKAFEYVASQQSWTPRK